MHLHLGTVPFITYTYLTQIIWINTWIIHTLLLPLSDECMPFYVNDKLKYMWSVGTHSLSVYVFLVIMYTNQFAYELPITDIVCTTQPMNIKSIRNKHIDRYANFFVYVQTKNTYEL